MCLLEWLASDYSWDLVIKKQYLYNKKQYSMKMFNLGILHFYYDKKTMTHRKKFNLQTAAQRKYFTAVYELTDWMIKLLNLISGFK